MNYSAKSFAHLTLLTRAVALVVVIMAKETVFNDSQVPSRGTGSEAITVTSMVIDKWSSVSSHTN